MSMAARAVSSRAVSSISLAGIVVMCLWERSAPLTLPSPQRGEGMRLALALALVAAELVLDGVHEGLPGGLDDVVGHPHRAPCLVAVAGGDEHAGLGRRALALVENADLVVEEAHHAQVRVEVFQSLAEGMVESIDGAVAGGRGVLGDAADFEPHRRLRHRLRAAALFIHDDPEAVELEVGPVIAEGALHEEL